MNRMMTSSRWLQPYRYRNLAAFMAVVGSILLWRHGQTVDMAAFSVIVFLLLGGLVAMVAVLLAIKQRDGTAIIQSLLLMLWQIGLPLLAMTKLAQLNH